MGEDGRELPAADTVVVLTGFRPDLSFLSELRLDLDPTLEAPRKRRGRDRPEHPLVWLGPGHRCRGPALSRSRTSTWSG